MKELMKSWPELTQMLYLMVYDEQAFHRIPALNNLSFQPVPMHLFASCSSVLDEITQPDVKDLLCPFSLSFTDGCPDPPVLSLTTCPVKISIVCKCPSLFNENIGSYKSLEQKLKEEHSVECA